MEPVLIVENLSKSFGEKRVVNNVSFSIKPGQIMAMIGENGAGKSTIKNMLCGLIDQSSGTIYFKGTEKSKLSPKDYRVSAIHQELSLFPNLSVVENICITNFPQKSIKILWNECRMIVQNILKDIGIELDLDRKVNTLSQGKAQIVEIAKALYQEPDLLILDEPTASLSIPEREKLFEVMRSLKKRNVGMIFITHFIDEVYAISDSLLILRNGSVVGHGETQNFRREEVEELLVGYDFDRSTGNLPSIKPNVLLSVENFSSNSFNDINFQLQEGEILGIFGLLGAGKTELIESIYGLRKIRTGTMELRGHVVPVISPDRMKQAGVVFLSEERKQSGIFPYRPIRENLTCLDLSRAVNRLIPNVGWRNEKKTAKKMAEKFVIDYHQIDEEIVTLSGGNQQKSILARLLAINPKICIFDDPTKGVDIGAKEQICKLIIDLAKNGCSIILVSSDLSEIIRLSHRIIVMRKGSFVNEFPREKFDLQKIVQAAALSS